MVMKYKNNEKAVYCCNHVFKKARKIKLVVFNEGDISYLCGESDHDSDPNNFYIVGVNHMVEYEPLLKKLGKIRSGNQYELNNDNEWIASPYLESPLGDT